MERFYKMIYLKTYEDFNRTQYAVGDIVSLSDNNIAKIKKARKNSYIVDIVKNSAVYKSNVEVRDEPGERLHIVGVIQSIDTPSISDDMIPSTTNYLKHKWQQPTNDFVINR